METVPRTQTAFRLKDTLLERLKWQAKKEHKSLNTLVEETLEDRWGRELVFPKLPPEFFEQAKELERCNGSCIPAERVETKHATH